MSKKLNIYFISDGDYVKIGVTKNCLTRLKQLQVDNPNELRLLGCFKGDYKLEKKIHRQFKESWVRGEWFKIEDALKKYIDILPKPIVEVPIKKNYKRLQFIVYEDQEVIKDFERFVLQKHGFTQNILSKEVVEALRNYMCYLEFENYNKEDCITQ